MAAVASGLLKNAHDALEADQQAIRLILSADPSPALAYQRMRVNERTTRSTTP